MPAKAEIHEPEASAADSTPAAVRLSRALCLVAARLYPREHPRTALGMLLTAPGYAQGARDAEAIAQAAGLGPAPVRLNDLPRLREIPLDSGPVGTGGRHQPAFISPEPGGGIRNVQMRDQALADERRYRSAAGEPPGPDFWGHGPETDQASRLSAIGVLGPDLQEQETALRE